MIAVQVAVDYLDTLSESPADDPLVDGLALHEALTQAVTPSGTHFDWYRWHPRRQDGGYLTNLISTCQQDVSTLPSIADVASTVRNAARRCGEGQSYTHLAAIERSGVDQLKSWASSLPTSPEYAWWERAAGASSSVGIHALIAAAATDGVGHREAEMIDGAYFPSISALTVLLDDLVDRDRDHVAHEHNYLSYYADSHAAAERFSQMALEARNALSGLRRRATHLAILMGVGGFYLSTPASKSEFASPIRTSMIEALGGGVRPILFAMRFLQDD
jgi:tetraprenyl-beta-curcumene synthase